MNALPPVRPIGDVEALRVIADGQRHRILAELIAAPLSAADIARRLALPRTRVYYHLELLERHGFIAVCGYRDDGGAERLYRATAASFRVDRRLLGSDAAHVNEARAELLDAAADDVRRVPPDDDDMLVVRTFVRMTARRKRALRKELEALLARYASSDDEGATIEIAAAFFEVPP